MGTKIVSQLVVRIGVFFLFVFFGAWEILQSSYWVGFVPHIFAFLQPLLLVKVHGAVLVFVGSGILIGKFLKFFALLGTLIMLEIVISLFATSGLSDVLIRDIGILIFIFSLLV